MILYTVYRLVEKCKIFFLNFEFLNFEFWFLIFWFLIFEFFDFRFSCNFPNIVMDFLIWKFVRCLCNQKLPYKEICVTQNSHKFLYKVFPYKEIYFEFLIFDFLIFDFWFFDFLILLIFSIQRCGFIAIFKNMWIRC